MSEPSTVKCAPNGPYLIQGPAVVVDPTGQKLPVAEGRTTALCRCGNSGNKPFCDGAHAKSGFAANEAARSS